MASASDGRMFKDEMKQLKSLGTIVIEAMHRVKVRVEDQIYVSDKIMPAAGVISEKALKGQAISHSTR